MNPLSCAMGRYILNLAQYSDRTKLNLISESVVSLRKTIKTCMEVGSLGVFKHLARSLHPRPLSMLRSSRTFPRIVSK